MTNPTRFLRILFSATLLTPLAFIAINETNMLTIEPVTDEGLRYIVNIIAVALTLACIPMALRLFTMPKPRRQGAASVNGYVRWAAIRIALLAVPLFYDVATYYCLGHYATCGWMAMMVAVMFLFVWPSDGRMRYERETAYPQDEQ